MANMRKDCAKSNKGGNQIFGVKWGLLGKMTVQRE